VRPLLLALLALAWGPAAAQEQECPGIHVGETTFDAVVDRLRASGATHQEVPADRDAGTGRALFAQGAPLCPGFGRPGQGTALYFVPGTRRLAAMIVNFRFSEEGHWALEQALDAAYADAETPAPEQPPRGSIAPRVTKTWVRDGLVVRLRRDAPDVPPLYSGVEYLRPDVVEEMESAVRSRRGAPAR
jgi:hypothetical protein